MERGKRERGRDEEEGRDRERGKKREGRARGREGEREYVFVYNESSLKNAA